jgi:hypothetical protein
MYFARTFCEETLDPDQEKLLALVARCAESEIVNFLKGFNLPARKDNAAAALQIRCRVIGPRVRRWPW